MADLKNMTVLVVGAGPRVIGQSAECDEGALEAVKALCGQGCRTITVNSNPDALMPAPGVSNASYLEPLTVDALERIMERENPDALLAAFGGRQGLHLAAQLSRTGKLKQYNVDLWGICAQTAPQVLNRDTLNAALGKIGLSTPTIFKLDNPEAAAAKAQEIGFPVVLRRADANRMPDGILVYNQDELHQHTLPGSGNGQDTLSIEASLLDWQQVELEILRDHKGKTYIAGGVEYIDTAAVHPGDAIAVCPPQSLSQKLISRLSTYAQHIAGHLQIIGSATIRFACRPADDAVLVLAVHPRYTRSSALIARIENLPLAAMAALLAAGFSIDNLPITSQPAHHPTVSATTGTRPVVGVKWPRWNFDKLQETVDRLGPQMQAVGQHIGFGGNFKEALQKAATAANAYGAAPDGARHLADTPLEDIMAALATPTSNRLIWVFEAIRRKVSIDVLIQMTHINRWFLNQFAELAELDEKLNRNSGQLPAEDLLMQAKAAGFSDAHIAKRIQLSAEVLRTHMAAKQIRPSRQSLSAINTGPYFTTYGPSTHMPKLPDKDKIVIIGSGAYAIGQGPECDYGIYQAINVMQEFGYWPIVLNANPAGITTAGTLPASCCCDPITPENIRNLLQEEKPKGVITQFAGNRSLALSILLAATGANILGTSVQNLTLVNDRTAFRGRLRELGIPQPAHGAAISKEAALKLSDEIGYPVQIHRFQTGADCNAVMFRDRAALEAYLASFGAENIYPLLVEQFLEYAIEAQAEVLCDGEETHVAAILEHIELAGVHAGDSACILPPYSISPRHVETICAYCQKVAAALEVKGLVNLRFAIYRDTVYLLEAAFNICRNLSVVERVHQLPLAALATRLMLGAGLKDLPLASSPAAHVGVRAAVFPFNVFTSEDPLLGPGMRSIGQVLSLSESFGLAYFKSQQAASVPLPTQGTVLITVTDEDKASILEPARIFHEQGFKIMATRGTHKILAANGIASQQVRKLGFGRPNLLDEIKNGNVQLVINTPTGGQGQIDDSIIRKTAIAYRVANMTTPASALAAAKGIAARRQGENGAKKK